MNEMEGRKSVEIAPPKAAEQFRNSAGGMRATAHELRSSAKHMPDTNDRDTMLRLADEYERRAGDSERRTTISSPT
jgi:hypothetical protein